MPRHVKDPILAVMQDPALWHSIQLKALHAELMEWKRHPNVLVLEGLGGQWHPGRYILGVMYGSVVKGLFGGLAPMYCLERIIYNKARE
jgi:hypothetical protein